MKNSEYFEPNMFKQRLGLAVIVEIMVETGGSDLDRCSDKSGKIDNLSRLFRRMCRCRISLQRQYTVPFDSF